jgi:hypothetical protein
VEVFSMVIWRYEASFGFFLFCCNWTCGLSVIGLGLVKVVATYQLI